MSRHLLKPAFYRRGFTLLEVLVVVTIVGILAGLTVISIEALEQRRLAAEADRLKLALNQALDSSLINRQTIGWFYDGTRKQYEFKTLPDTGGKIGQQSWQTMEGSIFARHTLHESATLHIGTDDRRANSADNTRGLSTKSGLPVLVFLTGGEYTPFTIYLTDDRRTSSLLQGDGFGAISYRNSDFVDKS